MGESEGRPRGVSEHRVLADAVVAYCHVYDRIGVRVTGLAVGRVRASVAGRIAGETPLFVQTSVVVAPHATTLQSIWIKLPTEGRGARIAFAKLVT